MKSKEWNEGYWTGAFVAAVVIFLLWGLDK